LSDEKDVLPVRLEKTFDYASTGYNMAKTKPRQAGLKLTILIDV